MQLIYQERVHEEAAAEEVMLEVQRLWPPFFGGARVCNEVRIFSMLNAQREPLIPPTDV